MEVKYARYRTHGLSQGTTSLRMKGAWRAAPSNAEYQSAGHPEDGRHLAASISPEKSNIPCCKAECSSSAGPPPPCCLENCRLQEQALEPRSTRLQVPDNNAAPAVSTQGRERDKDIGAKEWVPFPSMWSRDGVKESRAAGGCSSQRLCAGYSAWKRRRRRSSVNFQPTSLILTLILAVLYITLPNLSGVSSTLLQHGIADVDAVVGRAFTFSIPSNTTDASFAVSPQCGFACGVHDCTAQGGAVQHATMRHDFLYVHIK